jgi:hypothetical protein
MGKGEEGDREIRGSGCGYQESTTAGDRSQEAESRMERIECGGFLIDYGLLIICSGKRVGRDEFWVIVWFFV